MALSDDIDVLREVAAAICSLSSAEENKVEICDRAMSTVVTLALHDDPQTNKQAVSALANLAELVALHVKILSEDGLPPLVTLASSMDVDTTGEACRALANLAANPDVQAKLVAEGVLNPLIAGAFIYITSFMFFSFIVYLNTRLI